MFVTNCQNINGEAANDSNHLDPQPGHPKPPLPDPLPGIPNPLERSNPLRIL